MNSMTGFGRASRRGRQFDIDVEARSVNHRFLSLKISLPDVLSRFEGDVDKVIRSRVARGSVNVNVTLKNVAAGAPVKPDLKRIRETYNNLESIRKSLKLKDPVSFGALLTLPDVLAGGNHAEEEPAKAWAAAKDLVEKAVADLVRMRVHEGAAIKKDILARLDTIGKAAVEIAARAPQVVATYQRKLEERIAALTASKGIEVGKADLVKEIAVYADKCDISEELQRLSAHVESFRRIVDTDDSVGRRLDFLTQEMVRETNTLASKGSDSGISGAAVLIKAELEKIKEQAENVE